MECEKSFPHSHDMNDGPKQSSEPAELGVALGLKKKSANWMRVKDTSETPSTDAVERAAQFSSHF